MLHVIRCCTRFWPGHLSVRVGNRSRRSEEIVEIPNCTFHCDHHHHLHHHHHPYIIIIIIIIIIIVVVIISITLVLHLNIQASSDMASKVAMIMLCRCW